MYIIDNFVLPKAMEKINLSVFNTKERVLFVLLLTIIQNNPGYEFEISLGELSYCLGEPKSLSFYHTILNISNSIREKRVLLDYEGKEHRIFDYIIFDEHSGMLRFRYSINYENNLRELNESLKNPKKKGV